MSALSRIESAGFKVSLTGDNLEITPASQLTLPQRKFLKSHKAEIISELKAVTLPDADQHKILAWPALTTSAKQIRY